MAAAISSSRITAKQHFPSDVLIGSALGWFIGQEVYRHHHDPTLGGGEWETYAETHESGPGRRSNNVGSPYVELDSWIYPALDRLIGMGIIDSGFSGVRPWTRSECARMLEEASEKVRDASEDAERIYELLEVEFKEDLDGGQPYRLNLESIYTRGTEVSGEPLSLTSGYTFGQTLINDYGRPYERGFNSVTGASGWATAGALVGYVRVEYQQSPAAPPLSESARLTIGQVDPFPGPPPATPIAAVNQVQLLDAYVGLNLDNWQITFGKQSLWWGSGDGGPMLFSNNAPPITMFRVNRVVPLELPKFLHWLGPMRTELFFGQLSGYEFMLTPTGPVGQYGQSLNPQPLIHGQLISFKPTANFEFAFYRTTIYGGPGFPITFHHMISSLFTTGNENAGGASKPGDRRSGLNFSYRLPRLRDWLTMYGDGFTDDEISPIRYVNVSAWHAGIYLSHFPLFLVLDLRLEGVYTDVPGRVFVNSKQPGSFYENLTWRSGYTDDGALIGSWIGRGGQGAQVWSNYWFSPRNRFQVYFRHQKVSKEFLPYGGSLTDVGVRSDYSLRAGFSLGVMVQGERWLFPSIQPNASRDVTASVQIMFEPHKSARNSGAP